MLSTLQLAILEHFEGIYMLIHSQIVELKSADVPTFGYLAHPKGEGQYPAILILQERWGIDQRIQRITEQLAQEGFVTLAPDFYHGQVATNEEEAQQLAQQLDDDSVRQEILIGLNYLRDSQLVQLRRFGILSFGLGREFVQKLSVQQQDISALVLFDGWSDNTQEPQTEQTSQQATTIPLLHIDSHDDVTATYQEMLTWFRNHLVTP